MSAKLSNIGRPALDLTGKVFGELVVLHRDPDYVDRPRWVCLCSCGVKKTIRREHLTAPKGERTISCGHVREQTGGNYRHGGADTRLYKIWQGMKDRVDNSHNKAYRYYGARGVRIEDIAWYDYAVFQEWALANGYEADLSLDRKDTYKGYAPDNCRWATSIEQQNNKRNNIRLTAFGETQTVKEWSRDPRSRATEAQMRSRIKAGGWDDWDIVAVPPANQPIYY